MQTNGIATPNIAEDGRLFPVEVKLSASPARRDLRGIAALGRLQAPLGPGAVVAMVRTSYPVDSEVTAIHPDAIR